MKCPICNEEMYCVGNNCDGSEFYHCREHGNMTFFPDPWRDFRREASKITLAALVSGKYHFDEKDFRNEEKQDQITARTAYTAVKYVDALIEELKKRE